MELSDIDGPCQMAGREGINLVQAFNHEVRIPADPHSGLSMGKRVHRAVKTVKALDNTSPLLYQKLCQGEHFENVTLRWHHHSSTGQESNSFTHVLTDAILVSIRPWMLNVRDSQNEGYTPMEECRFRYDKTQRVFEGGRNLGRGEYEDSWHVPE